MFLYHPKIVLLLMHQSKKQEFMEWDHFVRNRMTVIDQWTFDKGFRVLSQLRGSILPIGVTRIANRLICRMEA